MTGISLGRAADSLQLSCLGTSPLFSKFWALVPTIGTAVRMGEWKLPYDPARPFELSAASIAIELVQLPDNQAWQAHAAIRFEDHQFPFGLPFTFPQIAFSYVVDGLPHKVVLDWSDGCSGVGRSIFPNGNPIAAIVDLPGSAGSHLFQDLRVTLWGSRN